jgi:intracellular septation protein
MKKLLFDLFPVILFFATFKFFSHGDAGNSCLFDHAANLAWFQEPILLATGAAIVATIVQVAWVKHRHGKVDTLQWISFAIITIFGGATLYFRNPDFIQLKPTILYWVIAAALVGTPLITGRNLIQSTMETQIHLPNHIWRYLNLAWALFFFSLGFANIAAVHWLSCNDWVSFKMFGITSLMFIFIIGQAVLLSKYVKEDKNNNQ